jgi:hypothetical protein
MFDSVNIDKIPVTGSQLIGYYLNGNYAVKSVADVEARFPSQKLIPIDVLGTRTNYARVFDVEKGDIQASQLEQIIANYNQDSPYYETGGRAVIYCDRTTIASVRVGTGKYLLGRDYYLWVSTLDGTEYTGGTDGVTVSDVVACQTETIDGVYDKSVVYSPLWVPS